MTPRRELIGAALLIAIFIGAAASSITKKSATVDEFAHLAAGCFAWQARDYSLYAKTPPTGRMLLTLPAALMKPKMYLTWPDHLNPWEPWRYGQMLMALNQGEYGRLLLASRLMGVGVGALVCVLVWRWSRARYGPEGGLTSLAACALCPTLIAHARLVTTDVVATLAALLLLMAMSHYLKSPSAKRAALTGLALGAATLCKFSAPLFAPFALLTPAVAWYYPSRAREQRPRVVVLVGHAALLVAVAWLVIVAGYLGDRDARTQYSFGSKTMKPFSV